MLAFELATVVQQFACDVIGKPDAAHAIANGHHQQHRHRRVLQHR
ncbi:hypothetical protein [Xanthomonas fragariae]